MPTENKAIFLLLTNTHTFFTRLIQSFTHAKYNHISIAFDSELNELYSFGRKSLVWPLFSGFRQEDIKNGLIYANTSCIF
ncbi:hypothetical protein KP78_16930 [Jeotgalibacillus soli]|uniref:Uncharacterized protein n=1 Tax=Jeotgalibacillus soli TaxID=889306 RepID=A0A0C2VUY9_9BACL|nr:hypothetical protein KP78_16930 [Jeotgalibacillus soli]